LGCGEKPGLETEDSKGDKSIGRKRRGNTKAGKVGKPEEMQMETKRAPAASEHRRRR